MNTTFTELKPINMILYLISFMSCLIPYGVLLRSPSQPQEERPEQETEYHHDWGYMHPEKYIH